MDKKNNKPNNVPKGSKNDNKQIYVNGPVNAMRLEGKVFGLKKVVYLLMDIHLDIGTQSKCDDIRSIDFNQYLINNFDNISEKDKIYDFFLEIYPTDIERNSSGRKDIYIREMRDLFRKSFVIDRETDAVGKSNTFPNIRFHYLDIRSLLYNKSGINKQIENIIHNYVVKTQSILPIDITEMKMMLNLYIKQLDDIYKIVYKRSPAMSSSATGSSRN